MAVGHAATLTVNEIHPEGYLYIFCAEQSAKDFFVR